MLLRNVGPDGGGLVITQSLDAALGSPFFIHISDCMFMNNIGNFGGGFKSIQLSSYLDNITVLNTTFANNLAVVGSALYLQSMYSVSSVTILQRTVVEDW